MTTGFCPVGLTRVACVVVVVTLVATVARRADAEDESQAAAAQALFDSARKLLDQQHYDEACSKLEESQRLDAAVGTLLYLGYCYEKAGRAASAWSAYKGAESAAAQAKQRDRERIAHERAAAIEPRLARLTVRLPSDASEAVTIRRDGVVLGQASIGQAVPVDAGTHVVEASAPGRKPWVKSVHVQQGSSVTVDVDVPPELLPKRSTASPQRSSPSNVGATGSASSRDETVKPAGRRLTTQRWAGIVTGSAGLIGLGIGAGFAWHAASKSSDAEHYRRPGTNVYDEPGYSLNQQALDSSRIALISNVVGLAALAGGAVLFFTAPSAGASQRDRTASILAVTELGISNYGVRLSGYWR